MLCARHLHANWAKRFPGLAYKDLFWEAARASNIAYHEAAMEKIRALSQDAFDALAKLPRYKWTRCGFKKGQRCDMLVNNWAEAFNICIMKARDQPILTMLNTIHQIVMARIVKGRKEKESWEAANCQRVEKLIAKREEKQREYTVRFCGNTKYEVSTAQHSFIVDIYREVCSCGRWEVSGIPCVHSVAVYGMENKNARQYVDMVYSREIFLRVYSHYLEPIGGPITWPKDNSDEILPPFDRVMPGRPRRARKVDQSEAREKAVAEKEKRQKKRKQAGVEVHKVSRKGLLGRCSGCGETGHNKRSCPFNGIGEGTSQQASQENATSTNATTDASSSQPPRRRSSSQPAPRRSKRPRNV